MEQLHNLLKSMISLMSTARKAYIPVLETMEGKTEVSQIAPDNSLFKQDADIYENLRFIMKVDNNPLYQRTLDILLKQVPALVQVHSITIGIERLSDTA